MIRGLVFSLALLAAGCGGHSNVQLSSSGSPSTGVSSGGSINVQGGSTLGALIAIGVLGATVYGESYDNGIHYRANPFLSIQPTAPAPQLDPSRSVHEQDCSKPIENRTANLKCR